MNDRRVRPQPTARDELLQQLPAGVLLDRIPTPVIGLGNDGEFLYANPACAAMLGYGDVAELVRQQLPAVLVDPALKTPHECISAFENARGKAILWWHADGYPVHTTISRSLLLRADDPLLLFTVIDINDVEWNQGTSS